MKIMNMPGFTAENSINKTRGRYCMGTAFDSPNASASVQPAMRDYCDRFLQLATAADSRGGVWDEFWWRAWLGCAYS